MAKGDFVIEGIAFTPADRETLRVLAAEPLLARCRKLARGLSISEHAAKKRLDHLRQQTGTATVDELMEWIWARREQLERLSDSRHLGPARHKAIEERQGGEKTPWEICGIELPTDPLLTPQIPWGADAEFHLAVRALIGWAKTMKRRDLLHRMSMAAAVAAAMPVLSQLDPDERERVALAVAAPRRVDAAVIDHIEEMLWHLRRQDDTLGPQAVLDTALAQRNLVLEMQAEAPGKLRPRLLSIYGSLSRLAGWLSFDSNDLDGAHCYYEDARRTAHRAEDADLVAYVLCGMSYIAVWQKMPRLGVDHAVAAKPGSTDFHRWIRPWRSIEGAVGWPEPAAYPSPRPMSCDRAWRRSAGLSESWAFGFRACGRVHR